MLIVFYYLHFFVIASHLCTISNQANVLSLVSITFINKINKVI